MVSLRQAVASGSTAAGSTWRRTPALCLASSALSYDRSHRGAIERTKVARESIFLFQFSPPFVARKRANSWKCRKKYFIHLIPAVRFNYSCACVCDRVLHLRRCNYSNMPRVTHWNWQICADVLALLALPAISDSGKGNLITLYYQFNRACNVILLRRHRIGNGLKFNVFSLKVLFRSNVPQVPFWVQRKRVK